MFGRGSASLEVSSTGGGSNLAWGCLCGKNSERNYGPAIDSMDCDMTLSEVCLHPQTWYRVDMAFQVGGSVEGKLFSLKI